MRKSFKKEEKKGNAVGSVIATASAVAAAPVPTKTANTEDGKGGKNGETSVFEKISATAAKTQKLKEKSASSSTLRVGPFAAIRENELKRQKKASLDLNASEKD
uniref:PEST proteolytic signal-containing nuclear protein n=1 Tax=Panagrellus redivivus TaxID=6233 RepID=A0A7E4VRJ0_PANRE